MTEKPIKHTKLNALILIGGKSMRMGHDKSTISYHGKPQWEYLIQLLEPEVDKVYVSVRENQKVAYTNVIADKEENLGPFGALLSAFEEYPNEAFLVIATDLPFIDQKTIQLIIEHRDKSKFATALKTESKDYPEPLACIWEPEALPTLKEFYKNKIYKPIQVLKNMPIKTIPINDRIVQNINTISEYEALKKSKKHLSNDLPSDT